MFIPHQDDGGSDRSDFNCDNDSEWGCWIPAFAVSWFDMKSFEISLAIKTDSHLTNLISQSHVHSSRLLIKDGVIVHGPTTSLGIMPTSLLAT